MSDVARRRALAAIFACIAIYGLTMGLSSPLLSLILESRGVARSVIGLNASMPAFGMLLVAPLIPGLIRRYGIRWLMVGCLLIDLSLMLLYPVFDQLYAWFAIRFVAGAAINALLVASETWINEVARDTSRGRVMGVYNTILAVSMAAGPLVIPVTGIVGWTPFLIGASFIGLAAIPLFFAGSSTPVVQGESSFNIAGFLSVAPVLAFAVLLFAWNHLSAASLLPVYGVRNGMADADAALMITTMGGGAVFLSFPIGWLADRFDRLVVLILCAAGVLAGTVLLPWVITDLLTRSLVLFFWGGILGGLYTVVLTLVGQRFAGLDLAIANVAIGVIWGIGSLTGPSLTGLAMDIWDPQGFPAALAGISVMFIVFALLRRRTGHG